MRLTVPGNILIAGEYAVLEEGGLGLAAAVEPRLEVSSSPAARLRISGIFGESSAEWPAGGSETGLLRHCVRHMAETRNGFLPEKLPLHLFIDSSAFYAGRGRKRGLGSSAAVVVALITALDLAFRRYGDSPVPADSDARSLLEDCVTVHRQFQGGRGSGYDVAASLFGGVGLFSGGRKPSWRPAEASWLREPAGLRLVEGEKAVRTRSAVAAYESWKHTHTERAHRYLSASNAAVAALAGTTSRREALAHLRELKRAAADLGNEIGFPADAAAPPPGWLCKSAGAGNETVICLKESGSSEQPVSTAAPGEPLQIALTGVQIIESLEEGR